MKHTIGIVYAISKEAGNACYNYLSKIVPGNISVIAFENPQVEIFSQAKLIPNKSERIQAIAEALYSGVKTLISNGATVIIIAANSVHIAFDRLREMSVAEFPYVEVLSIVDAVVDSCKKYPSVAIFGSNATIESEMYQEKLSSEQIAVIPLDASEQAIINNAISAGYMPLTMPAELHREIRDICEKLKCRGCDAVVLACTELPLLLDADDFAGLDMIDSNQALAEYAVKIIKDAT
jgi:aspartate racemase